MDTLLVFFYIAVLNYITLYSIHGKKVEGEIIYPSNFPNTLKEGSCLVVSLYSMQDGTTSLATQKVENPTSKINTKYSLPFPGENVDLGAKYFVDGFINVGWCSDNDKKKENTKRDGDYEATGGFLPPNQLAELTQTGQIMRGPTLHLNEGKNCKSYLEHNKRYNVPLHKI